MGELKQKTLVSNVKDLEKQLDDESKENGAGEEAKKAIQAKISAEEKKIREKSDKLGDVYKKMGEIHKRFRAYAPKVRKEKNKYKDMKNKGASKDELDQQASVVKQVVQKLKDINREKK